MITKARYLKNGSISFHCPNCQKKAEVANPPQVSIAYMCTAKCNLCHMPIDLELVPPKVKPPIAFTLDIVPGKQAPQYLATKKSRNLKRSAQRCVDKELAEGDARGFQLYGWTTYNAPRGADGVLRPVFISPSKRVITDDVGVKVLSFLVRARRLPLSADLLKVGE